MTPIEYILYVEGTSPLDRNKPTSPPDHFCLLGHTHTHMYMFVYMYVVFMQIHQCTLDTELWRNLITTIFTSTFGTLSFSSVVPSFLFSSLRFAPPQKLHHYINNDPREQRYNQYVQSYDICVCIYIHVPVLSIIHSFFLW